MAISSVQNVVGPATVTASPGTLVSVNAAGGSVTVILPPADGSASSIVVGRTDTVLSNTVTVTANPQVAAATSASPSGAAVQVAPTIVGESTINMTGQYVTYTETGSVWYGVAGVKPTTSLDGRYGLAGAALLASPATTTGAVTVSAFDELQIVARVTGMSVGDIPALRFNADNAAHYWSRYITAAAGGVTLVDAPTVSATMARLSGTSATTSRVFTVTISNNTSTSKVGVVLGADGTGAAGTAGALDIAGQFEWVNTSAQITSVELLSAGGTATLSAGSGLHIYGKNFT